MSGHPVFRRLGPIAVGIVGLASPALAAPVAITFTGSVVGFDATMSGYFAPTSIGDAVTFIVYADNASADTNADPTIGEYIGAVTGTSLTIGALTQTGAATGGMFQVHNLGLIDIFRMRVETAYGAVTTEFHDNSGTAFASDAFPASLDPSLFNIHISTEFSETPPDNGILLFQWTDISMTSIVPLPGPAALAAVGLAPVGLFRRRR